MPPRPDSSVNFRRSLFPLWILCLLALSAAAWAGPPSVRVVNPQTGDNISSLLTPRVYVISGTAHNADQVQIAITGVGAVNTTVAVHGNVWEYAWSIPNNGNGAASITATPLAHTASGTPSAAITVNVANASTLPAGGLSILPSGVTPSVYLAAAAVSGVRAATDNFPTGIKLNYVVGTAPATHPNVTLGAFTPGSAAANTTAFAFTFDITTPKNLNNDAGLKPLPTSFTLGDLAPGLLPGLTTISALLYANNGAADVSQVFNRSVIVDNRAPDVVTSFSFLYPQDSAIAAGVAPPTPPITPPASKNIRFYGRVQDYDDVAQTLPDDVARVEIVVRYPALSTTTERIPATLIYGEPDGATSAITTWYADFSTLNADGTLKSDGSYSAYAVITDNAGNQTIDKLPDPVTHIATPFLVDNTAPLIGTVAVANNSAGATTGNTATAGYVFGATTVSLGSVTETGTGVNAYELRDYTGSDTTGLYRVIKSATATVPVPASIPWDTTQASDGQHTIALVVTDKAGNVSDVTRNTARVYVDNSVPCPTFAFTPPTPLNPDPTKVYKGASVAVSANVTDSWVDTQNKISISIRDDLTPFNSVTLTSPSLAPNSTTAGIPVSGHYDSTVITTPGTHTLTLTATNQAGRAVTTTTKITVDNAAPTGFSLAASPVQTVNHVSKTVLLTGSYVEDFPKTWQILYRINGSGANYAPLGLSGANDKADGAVATPTTHSFSTGWDTTTIADGTYDLVIQAVDEVGNTNSVTMVTAPLATVIVANTPAVKIIFPKNNNTVTIGSSVYGFVSSAGAVVYTFSQTIGGTVYTATQAADANNSTTVPDHGVSIGGVTHTFDASAITVTLTATDAVGNKSSDAITIYIGAASPVSIQELDFNDPNPLAATTPAPVPLTDNLYYLRKGIKIKGSVNVPSIASWALDVTGSDSGGNSVTKHIASSSANTTTPYLTDYPAAAGGPTYWDTTAADFSVFGPAVTLTLTLTAVNTTGQTFTATYNPVKIDNILPAFPPTGAISPVSSSDGAPDFARGTAHLQAVIIETNPKSFQFFVDGAALDSSGNRLSLQPGGGYLAEYDWNTTGVDTNTHLPYTDGPHILTIQVTDKAGNQNSATATAHTVTVINQPPTPQFINISWGTALQFSSSAILSGPLLGQFPSGVVVGGGRNNPDVKNRVALGFSLGSNNVQSWTLTANGKTIGGAYPLDTSGLWDTTTQTVPGTPDFLDGPVTLALTVKDKAGNIKTQTSAVTVDNTQPIPTLSTPANNAFVNKIVAITGNVQEPNLPSSAANGSEFAIYPFTNLNDTVPATTPLSAPQIPGNIVTGTLTAPTLAPVPKPITSIQTPWMPLDLTAPPLVARTPRKFRIQLSPTDVVGNTSMTFANIYVADPAARLTLNTPAVADDESPWLNDNSNPTDYRSKVAYVKGSNAAFLQGTLMNWASYRLFDSATTPPLAMSGNPVTATTPTTPVTVKQSASPSWNLAEGRHRLRLVAINDNLNTSDDPTNAGNKSANSPLNAADFNNFNSAFASLEVVVDSTKPVVTISAPQDILQGTKNRAPFPVAPGSILTLIFTINNTKGADGSASPLKGVAGQGRPALTLTIPQVGNPSLFDFNKAVTNPTLTGPNGTATLSPNADGSIIQVVWQLPIVASTYAYGKTYFILISGISDLAGNIADTPVQQKATLTQPTLYYQFQVR